MIIGTAGHVDHGKTALVKALTGVDTDRLEEERRRRLTIELGFAPLDLPDGRRASIVDVPGHEKFIPTMLSGAAGMDCVLLVVAADEGPMPQTREHLDILSLLGVETGVIVFSRADLAGPEQLAKSRAATQALVRGTFLEHAPLVAASAVTGQGLEELLSALCALPICADAPGIPRLHVDRAFSVDGSGTVVTGTLTGGPLHQGDGVQLWPSDRVARIRGLQCHGVPAEELGPGTRAAVNLARVKTGQVGRGDTLAPPGSLTLTDRADVGLRLLPHAPFPVRHDSQLHFHLGARSLVCRCVLLGRDVLEPGQEGFAQLRFPQPIAAAPGDRFVVRSFSPLATLGGGVLLDLTPPKKGRMAPARLEGLARLARGETPQPETPAPPPAAPPLAPEADPALMGAILALYREAGLTPPDSREAEERLGADFAAFRAAVRTLTERGDLVALSKAYRAYGPACRAALEELRARFGSSPFTLAQARDTLGTTRRYALLLLDYWDRQRITMHIGDTRTFR